MTTINSVLSCPGRNIESLLRRITNFSKYYQSINKSHIQCYRERNYERTI